MRALMIGLVLGMLGCRAHAPVANGDRLPAAFFNTVRPSQPVVKDLRFDSFKNLLLGERAHTVEQTLGLLSAHHREYLAFHTLMYDSFSIQKASFEEPRAIVFGPEARFVFSFNGGHLMGANEIETMEYDDQAHRFLFREVIFKTAGFDRDELNLRPSEIDVETADLIISRANPQKCLQCHGANASPIWQTYFLWSGAYGSNDDMLYMSFDSSFWNGNNRDFFLQGRASSQGRNMSLRPDRPDTELLGFARYAALKPAHPRYKYLPERWAEKAVIRYLGGATLAQVDAMSALAQISAQYDQNAELRSRPNNFLLIALQTLEDDRLMAQLKAQSLEGAYRAEDWDVLRQPSSERDPKRVISKMVRRMKRLFAKISFRGKRPTTRQIRARLIANLTDEIGFQRERIFRQDFNLDQSALRQEPGYHTGSDGLRIREPLRTNRDGLPQVENSISFYRELLTLTDVNEIDRIALTMETDDQFYLKALDLVLADQGVDLRQYTMNLRQTGLTFNSGGIKSSLKFLGLAQDI